MWLNHFEIDIGWTAFQLFLELHFHISLLRCFCTISVISEFSFLDVRLKTKTWNHGKFLFLGYKAEMHLDLCYDHYFNFWRVKYDISKNELNLINLERSEALKRQIPATWSAMRLNHFEMMSFKQYFIGFWSYILTFQYFGIFDEFP